MSRSSASRHSAATSSAAEARFQELVAYAEAANEVLALFVFGSRNRGDFADESSDYDVGVVVKDGALEAFDERWPHERGASLEVVSSTLDGLREHAEPGTPSEWARYQYAHAAVVLDKTGEVAEILKAKGGSRSRIARRRSSPGSTPT